MKMVEPEDVGSLKCNECGCPVYYIIFIKGQAFTMCQKCGVITFGEFFKVKDEEICDSGAQ